MLLKQYPGKRIRFKYIGGGGGKGQRIVDTPQQVPDAIMEVLIESKMIGVGNNRNMLIELNIEDTRHNEIQLLGNGDWCIALGGRDCSLQMHEQKLFEISLTSELLQSALQNPEYRSLAPILKKTSKCWNGCVRKQKPLEPPFNWIRLPPLSASWKGLPTTSWK